MTAWRPPPWRSLSAERTGGIEEKPCDPWTPACPDTCWVRAFTSAAACWLTMAGVLARTKGRDRIEKRIGIFKGPLAVRPMFLEKAERIRAMLFICLVALLVYSLLEQRARQAGLPLTGHTVLERFAACSAVRTTFADGTTLLLAAPFSAWQQAVAQALALSDPNHWLVPLDSLPT